MMGDGRGGMGEGERGGVREGAGRIPGGEGSLSVGRGRVGGVSCCSGRGLHQVFPDWSGPRPSASTRASPAVGKKGTPEHPSTPFWTYNYSRHQTTSGVHANLSFPYLKLAHQ